MSRPLLLANIRQLYDKASALTLSLIRNRPELSRQDEPSPMKKATQSTQALNSKNIRLSWPRYFIISLRNMEVPEHSIPQMWMRPTKVISSCYTWVFRVLLWRKGIRSSWLPHLFITSPLAFSTNAEKHYPATDRHVQET